VGHQDYFLAPLSGSIALFVSSLGIHIVRCNPFIMGKPHDGKFPILPSTTRRGTTLNTSVALDSPSVMSKLLTPPHAHATTSTDFENASNNFDDASTLLDESGSLGSFLDATITRTKQMRNATVTSASSDAGAIRDLLARRAIRYKLSPDAKFATSPISISDKDYDFSLDLSYISIIEKEPFYGTKNESAMEHMNELSSLINLFSDDTKLRTYFVAKIFPFLLKGAAKAWFNNLSPGSIDSPIALVNAFFQKYFPASAQHAALQKIFDF
jgi:hypothetical protein